MIRALLGLVALLAGCAVPVHQGTLNTARFPAGAPAAEVATADRVGLLVPAPVQATVYLGEQLIGTTGNRRQLRVPIGQIVEQAAFAALDNAPPEKVKPVLLMRSGEQRLVITLIIDAIRFSYHEHTQFVLPLILPGALPSMLFFTEVDTKLAFDARLVDASGNTLLTRTYDAGREVWKQPPGTAELSADGIVRLAHEAAWRLAQQATRDLLDALALERNKQREL